MDDSTLRDQIEQLVAEEQRLMQEAEGHGPDDARHGRLAELKVELDRCWDLLRQREAREEFQLDPDDASVRDAGTVEGYEQERGVPGVVKPKPACRNCGATLRYKISRCPRCDKRSWGKPVAGWIGVAPPSSASSADSRTIGRCCRFAFVAGSSRAPCRLDEFGQARLRAGKGAGRALKRLHLLPRWRVGSILQEN